MANHPTLGVEEEFLLADPTTGEPVAENKAVAAHAAEHGVKLQLELSSCQVETTSEVVGGSDALRKELTRLRSIAAEAAKANGAQLLAAALPPTRQHDFPITDTPRYREIADKFGMVAEEGVCGAHVHVAVPSREAGIRGQQPATAMAAAVPGAERQLGGLPQRGHRLRQLAQHRVGAMAQRRSATAFRLRRRVRRDGADVAARRGGAR